MTPKDKEAIRQLGAENGRLRAALEYTRKILTGPGISETIVVLAEEAVAEALAATPARVEGFKQPELEIWLCPVHRQLDDSRQLTPLDNCVACIRVERDELRAKLANLDRLMGAE